MSIFATVVVLLALYLVFRHVIAEVIGTWQGGRPLGGPDPVIQIEDANNPFEDWDEEFQRLTGKAQSKLRCTNCGSEGHLEKFHPTDLDPTMFRCDSEACGAVYHKSWGELPNAKLHLRIQKELAREIKESGAHWTANQFFREVERRVRHRSGCDQCLVVEVIGGGVDKFCTRACARVLAKFQS